MSSRLYQQVKNTLIHDIRSGKYRAGQRLPNQQDLCQRFSASSGTISRAIKELSEEGIVEARPKHGAVVKPRKSQYRGKIGFLHSRMLPGESPGGTTLFDSFRSALSKHQLDFQYMPFTTTQKGAFPAYRDVSELYGKPFSALICIDLMDIEFLARLKPLSMPVIVLDRNTVDIGLDCVTFNNIQSSFEMTTRFIQDGHRQIAFLGGVLPNSPINQHGYDPSTTERYTGYVMAHHMAGIEVDEGLVRYLEGPDDKGGRYSIASLFKARPQVSAMLTCSTCHYFDDALSRAVKTSGQSSVELATWAWGAIEKDVLMAKFRYLCHYDLSLMAQKASELVRQRLEGEGLQHHINNTIIPGEILD